MIRYLVIIASAFAAPLSTVNPCEGLMAKAAWVRQPPPGQNHVAAYLVLINTGARSLRITNVHSPDFESAMLHETMYTDGQARMRHIPAIDLIPGSKFHAQPGGAHIMLTGPTQPIGTDRVVTLTFECAASGSLTISLPVRKDAPE